MVFRVEIVFSVQEETAKDAAVESDDIGPEVGHDFQQKPINGKFQSCADGAYQRVEDEIPEFFVELI